MRRPEGADEIVIIVVLTVLAFLAMPAIGLSCAVRVTSQASAMDAGN